jgi:4-oxalocrotonate tautomerase
MKHFAPELSNQQQTDLVNSITSAVTRVTGCKSGAISIELEAIKPGLWNELVYLPEIKNRKEHLCKQPDY